MATKYEALVEARLVGSSIQNAINAQAKSANLTISNVTVNAQNLISSIQKELSSANFQINLSGINSQAQAAGKTFGNSIKAGIQNGIGDAKVASQINAATDSVKSLQTQLTAIKSSTLSNNIETWANKNTVAAKKFSTELENIQARLRAYPEDASSLKIAAAEFTNLKARAQSAGIVVNQFAKNFKNLGLQMLGLGSAYQVGMKAIQTVKTGISTVVGLDTALVDLRKTTTMSSSDLADFYKDANTEAKALGTTTQQIIQSAADWSRLGYSSKADATHMARYAAQFAAISPGMDVESATTGLVSMMKAYGIETDEVLDGIMSKINRVGNTAATNNAEIVAGLQNSASALAAMNTDLDKSIALFTAGQEISQNATKVGNGLRSIALRIRGYDEETEQLSEDLVNIKGEVIDLTKVASNNYKGVSLFTDETQTQYKDVYDYLQDISEIWDELDAKTKQTLMEKLFGKNRANIGLAIIQNFSAAEKALDEMANSAGDADREMSIIMDSLEYKLNALKETGVGIWQNLFPREDIGNIIDGLTKVASVIQSVTGALGPIKTLLVGGGIFGAIKLLKNLDWPTQGTLNSEIFKQVYYGQEHAVMVA